MIHGYRDSQIYLVPWGALVEAGNKPLEWLQAVCGRIPKTV